MHHRLKNDGFLPITDSYLWERRRCNSIRKLHQPKEYPGSYPYETYES